MEKRQKCEAVCNKFNIIRSHTSLNYKKWILKRCNH